MKMVSNIKLRAKLQIITLKLLYTEENTWQPLSESLSRAFCWINGLCYTDPCDKQKLFIKTVGSKDASLPKCSTASSREKFYNPINATNITVALSLSGGRKEIRNQ